MTTWSDLLCLGSNIGNILTLPEVLFGEDFVLLCASGISTFFVVFSGEDCCCLGDDILPEDKARAFLGEVLVGVLHSFTFLEGDLAGDDVPLSSLHSVLLDGVAQSLEILGDLAGDSVQFFRVLGVLVGVVQALEIPEDRVGEVLTSPNFLGDRLLGVFTPSVSFDDLWVGVDNNPDFLGDLRVGVDVMSLSLVVFVALIFIGEPSPPL